MLYTIDGEWGEAENLTIGDLIWNLDSDCGAVEAIDRIHTQQPMYNLTVDEAHTFFVGDNNCLVHNICVGRMFLVGEGNFSFARSLVENGHVSSTDLVATSYQLLDQIPDKVDNINWLQDQVVTVIHGIDAHQLQYHEDWAI